MDPQTILGVQYRLANMRVELARIEALLLDERATLSYLEQNADVLEQQARNLHDFAVHSLSLAKRT